MQTTRPIHLSSPADRRILTNGLTLVGLGLSILFLNSWDSPFVRTSIGLFWAAFFLISNWSALVQALHGFRHKHDGQRRGSHRSSA
jgi:hypothetical protein